MTTLTWTNGGSGDWYAAANWSPQQTPQSGDTAVIAAGTANLTSLIDPASGMTLLLGGPTVTGASGGPAPGAAVYTLNTGFGPGFTLADTVPGAEGLLGTSGITTFDGVMSVSGANTALAVAVDLPSQGGAGPGGGVKFASGLRATANVVANPAGIGQFQNNGTIVVDNGAALLLTPLATADIGQVSMLVGTVNLNHGSMVAADVELGPPTGGLGASGTINLANQSNLFVQTASNISIDFQDGAGNKVAFNSVQEVATIAGFRAGDEIVQAPQSLFGTSTPYQNLGIQWNQAEHTLQITTGVGGTPYLDFALAGTYTQDQFQAANDASGNLIITTTACFAAGTRIATASGPVAVEALTPGAPVLLAAGGAAPVAWIGHRRIDCTCHPRPESVRPVRIAAHAFGMGRPARTLHLSPDHAVFIDGVLIPIRYLLNGATVAQVPVRRVHYFHVELPAHAVLLAEGLPCESYLDTGNRAAFSNGGRVVTVHPDFARAAWAASACAPLVTEGPVRDRVYRRLIAQALALGWTARPAEGPGRIAWRAPRRLRTA